MATRLPADALPLRMSGDGRFLFVARTRALTVPCRADRFELATGRLAPWKEFRPADITGVIAVGLPRLTPDGEAYAYSYLRCLQDLYLIEGLRP